jgi:hypothetical protein
VTMLAALEQGLLDDAAFARKCARRITSHTRRQGPSRSAPVRCATPRPTGRAR